MSQDKICPIMSRPIAEVYRGEVKCQKEKCQLWVERIVDPPFEPNKISLVIEAHCGLVKG